jgi:hypothetical protein
VSIPAPECAQPDYDEGVDRHPGRTSNLLATAPAMALCDFSICVMRGAKWLVRHKMATLALDILKKNERAIAVAAALELGGPQG